MTTPLSPAAQAVMDAAFPVYDEEENLYVVSGEQHAGLIAAAALRALAMRINGADAIRQDVLDIAAELEAQ